MVVEEEEEEEEEEKTRVNSAFNYCIYTFPFDR